MKNTSTNKHEAEQFTFDFYSLLLNTPLESTSAASVNSACRKVEALPFSDNTTE